MSESKAISIKEYAVKYTIIIFVVIFIASMLHYFVYSQYLHDLQKKEYEIALIQSGNSVNRSLNFYQSIVDEIALQHVVIDLLQFGTDEEIQQWSNKMQRLLPESIGLTLFDSHGKIRGIEGELRLNDSCIADMNDRFQNKQVARPPVHYQIKELAHYDIVSPIVVEGEQIGVVFASFSLDTIRRLLTGLYNENIGLKVSAADGYLIAELGHENGQDGNIDIYKQKIKGTDWEIELSAKNIEENVLVTSLLISNLVVFVVLSLILYFAIKRLFDVVISDFEILSWLMQKIKNGTYRSEDVSTVSLKEAQNVIRFIQFTATELNAYQEKLKIDSTTDDLTGLLNRRALNAELDNCLHMADKGKKIYMVILDLDHFKKINDTYGHDAGDTVLILFSEALKINCKEEDICARAGGDEFIVMLTNYDADEVDQWYARISDAMVLNIKKYNEKNSTDLKFGISAGCTYIRNNDRKSTVLKRADNALYKVKEGGRNKVEHL